MKTFLLVAAFFLGATADAGNWFVSQAGAGTMDGQSAANAWPVSKFNASGATTAATDASPSSVRLLGLISQAVAVPAGGTPCNRLEILFGGARLSQPSGGAFNVNGGLSNITFDGEGTGIIENTDNGSRLGSQANTAAFYVPGGSGNLVFQNLTISNLYVHAQGDPAAPGDLTTVAGIYLSGYQGVCIVKNVTFSNVCWCISGGAGSSDSSLVVTGCNFQNYDHGIAGIGRGSLTVTGNHFGPTANWDTPTNTYHHDGIHVYWGNGGGPINNAVISDNLFYGDWGANNTAHVFCELNYNTHDPTGANNWTISGNVHVENPHAAHTLNNGFLVAIGNNWTISGNKYLGAGLPNSSAVGLQGTGFTFTGNTVSGVNNFIGANATTSFTALDGNTYANPAPGGAAPFVYKAVPQKDFAAWQAVTGMDLHSFSPAFLTLSP